ncbi:MAG: hypothetical protein JWM44_4037 [Bacilli bacterium]|nr:hypothetical protein [Bacilli bacterium]
MISDENYKQYQENLIVLGTNTEYFIKDLDGDGYNELITKRITYVEGPPFYFETLFTIFKLNDEKLKPVKAFLVNGINQTFIEQLLHGEPIDIERNNKELIDEGLIIKESGNQYRISVQ